MRKIAIVLLIMFGVLLTSLLFIGCKTTTSAINKETKDTSSSSQVTNNETEIKDSSRIQPKVEIKYVIVNPCDSNGKLKPINQSTSNGSGKLKTTSNKDTLFIDCDCEEQIQHFRTEIRNKDSLVSNLKTRLIIDSKNETIKVEITPVWVWKLIAFLLLVILILSTILYIKLRK